MAPGAFLFLLFPIGAGVVFGHSRSLAGTYFWLRAILFFTGAALLFRLFLFVVPTGRNGPLQLGLAVLLVPTLIAALTARLLPSTLSRLAAGVLVTASYLATAAAMLVIGVSRGLLVP